MVPLEEPICRPLGRAGDVVHTTVPVRLTSGSSCTHVVFRRASTLVCGQEYAPTTSNVTVTLSEPPLLFAQMV